MNGERQVGPALVVRNKDRWSLLAARCVACGLVTFPSLMTCPRCAGQHFDSTVLPSAGTLYTFSVIHIAQKSWKVPYAAGYIDLAPELRVFGRLDISEGALQIGMPVELVVRPVEDVANRFTYAFVSGRASTGEVRA